MKSFENMNYSIEVLAQSAFAYSTLNRTSLAPAAVFTCLGWNLFYPMNSRVLVEANI